jgi:hypothetical protein
MAKNIKRECPRCKVSSEYRADQKTCGSDYCKSLLQPIKNTSDQEKFLKSEVASLTQQINNLKKFNGYQKVLNESIKEAIDAVEPLPAIQYNEGNTAESEIVAVFKVSDWHIGAVTNSWETEGFGQFNWLLAQERVHYMAKKFLGWIETHRKSFKINKLYILSEGDMISGNIHYELDVTNEFPAPVQAVKAGSLLAQFVATLAPHFKEVHFSQINIDNHSRLTKKLQFSEGAENSWGYIVHAIANAKLEKHGNINVLPAGGIRQIVDVNGIKFLTEHGHEIKAFLGIPFYGMERLKGKEASKRMHAMLDQERNNMIGAMKKDIGFDYMSIGHWHVPSIISNSILVNGCLPGTTEYDHAYGRSAKPSQVSFLVHPRYGIYNWTAWAAKQ